MAGLLDFLQAASNSAASNVSVPVDGLAWLLRKAGIDVGEPVGGSAWMERQGLTRPVKQSGASLAGETAGLLAPIAAAAKAPQIAKGLLQMGENAAAPRTLRPDQGAIVWHGSPHKFDRFDSSKIGTGEGAQAYGHGLYLAESPDVAKSYQTVLSKFAPSIDGKSVLESFADGTLARQLSEKLGLGRGESIEAANLLGQSARTNTPLSNLVDEAVSRAAKFGPEEVSRVKALGKRISEVAPQSSAGSLYKVDLPDDAIARMLDWDKPLSQQAPEVKDIFSGLSRLGVDDPMSLTGGTAYRRMHEAAIRQGKPEPAAIKEAQMVRGLRNAGLPGIRYLDGGSRGAGTGTSNFVVFPGEESLLTILERNGIPLR